MHITKAIVALSCALVGSTAFAQSEAISTGKADSASLAQTGPITFEGSHQRGSINTTPPVYVAPSMMAPGTCGMSDTASVSVTGFGIGGSKARIDDGCDARQDTSTAWNLGYREVAAIRFFCFGSDENRMAFESVPGNVCPEGATAKGLQRQQAVAGYQGNDPIVLQRLAGNR